MDNKSIKVLEFYKIVEMLKECADTELGKDKANHIDMLYDLKYVEEQQNETQNAYNIIMEKGKFSFGGVSDIRDYVKRATMGGSLTPKALLRCADTIRMARELKYYICDNNKDDKLFISLIDIAEHIYCNKSIEEQIYFSIISEEEVADDASLTLKKIRRDMKSKQQAIKSKINSMVNSSTTSQYLQDNIVTMRNDRYVLPVKSQYKNVVRGMVHDQSSSGQTLFIEPIQIVELNNQLTQLRLDEKKEIERILYVLSAMIAEVGEQLKYNQGLLTKLDFILAKGKLAHKMNAIKPELNDDGKIRIRNGRHPLIDAKSIVPTNINMGYDFTQLIVTGPNTGGKTVCLKTIGLFCLMAMAGLHVPCDYGTILSIFDNVYADIGDEQSIEQSLSTFSSHMTKIVEIMNDVTSDSLVLFDELGAGTDPDEGAALAMAILDTLRTRKIITAATTHYSELKLYALSNEGVCNACVEFDVNTLSPTYRVLVGVPGKSNAFAISEKLGLQKNIINIAKAKLTTENVEFEDILAKIENDRKYIEMQRTDIEILKRREEESLKQIRIKEKKVSEKNERIVEESKYEARQILEDAKREAQDIIKKLKKLNLDMDNERSREVYELRHGLNKKMNKVNTNLKEADFIDDSTIEEGVISIGDYVLVKTLNQKGNVLSIDKKQAEIQLGLMKFKAKIEDLVKLKNSERKSPIENTKKRVKLRTDSVKPNIDVRGLNLEEALQKIDKYIDDASLAGLNDVTIIHGKGTGVLRKGINKYLKSHRGISEYRLGEFKEGGDGVTVAHVK